jgi:hypothetical protein
MFNPMATYHGGENIFELNLMFLFLQPSKVVNMKIALLGSKKYLKKKLSKRSKYGSSIA